MDSATAAAQTAAATATSIQALVDAIHNSEPTAAASPSPPSGEKTLSDGFSTPKPRLPSPTCTTLKHVLLTR